MNKLMIGLAVGLGTFAIAEACKASKAIAKQKAAEKKMDDAIVSQKVKERYAELDRGIELRAKLQKDLEQTTLKLKATTLKLKALEDEYIVSKSETAADDELIGLKKVSIETIREAPNWEVSL